MNSNNRIAATLFPRDIVCLRNISINTLHKGDDDDDDDNNNNKLGFYIAHIFFNLSCLYVISLRFKNSVTVLIVQYFTKSAFRSITEFLECNCMTFVSAGCALATY
jgi:hypothetical protein